MAPLTKSYPTFDCDAHVTELPAIWDHIAAKDKDLVKQWYWADGDDHILNGRETVRGIWAARKYIASCSMEASGPGSNIKYIRKMRDLFQQGKMTPEQMRYTNNDGARDPQVRLRDMDLMGIDQVVVIPISMFIMHPWVENVYAAEITSRAYNDWVHDWCSAEPNRLFAGATVPIQSPVMAAAELRRAAKKGFHIGMVHPADQQSNYPNQAKYDPLWQAFDETGLACAMHTLPGSGGRLRPGVVNQISPGHFTARVCDQTRSSVPDRIGFCYEAMLWITNVVLSGFLEKYPKLSMALMEANAVWLPTMLEQCDRAFLSYKNLRKPKVTRLPSEIFQERCFVSFEGEETPVFQDYKWFENLGIWASDVYHGDGADAWSAIHEMEKLDVPLEAQVKLMGGNARRMYKIEPKMFTTKEPASYPRPDWYPTMEQIKKEYASVTNVS